jgi:electron transfer flavoprotein alpha subunit
MIDVNPEGEVWVVAEAADGQLRDISLELLNKARELADELGVALGATLAAHNTGALAPLLIAHGADKVYVADDELLEPYQTSPHTRVLTDLVEEHAPQIVLFGATPVGRDLSPRVASTLFAGLTADCTELGIGPHTEPGGIVYENLLLAIRPAFGASILATIVNFERWPQMATIREGVIPLGTPDHNRTGEIIAATTQLNGTDQAIKILKRTVREQTGGLKRARVVVAGGMGMGSADNFQQLHELADVLDGQVGCSRPVTDAGWMPRDRQIGQTGVTVRPALYVAAGISGAIQHISGMSDAKKVIAINTDPQAPIFEIADYRIVGDVNKVVPHLIEAVRERV